MSDASDGMASIWDAILASLGDIYAYLPVLATALLVLVSGWIIARIARAAVRRLADNANRVLDRMFERSPGSGARVSRGVSGVLGGLAFWFVLILSAAVAIRVTGFTAVSDWLGQAVAHLPNLVIGIAIIVIGYVASVALGEQVAAAARAAKAGHAVALGRIAQGTIFVTTFIAGLDQIGVNVTLLVALFVVVAGAVLAGFSIAFGLGAREFVSDLIGARAVRRDLKAGLNVQIGDVTGRVLEITATHVALDTPRGKALVPARIAAATPITILDAMAERETP